METSSILMLVHAPDRASTASGPQGLWLEDFAAPYYVFSDLRCDITVASPEGGRVTVDPQSTEEDAQTASVRRFVADASAQAVLADTVPLSQVNPQHHDAVFIVATEDTASNTVNVMLDTFYAQGKPAASGNGSSSSIGMAESLIHQLRTRAAA